MGLERCSRPAGSSRIVVFSRKFECGGEKSCGAIEAFLECVNLTGGIYCNLQVKALEQLSPEVAVEPLAKCLEVCYVLPRQYVSKY